MGYDATRFRLLDMGSKGNRYGPSDKDRMERGMGHQVWDMMLRGTGYQVWDPKATCMDHQVRIWLIERCMGHQV